MTGVSARVELQGIAEAQAGLARLAALGADMAPIYDAIGMAMVSSQQHRFELGVEPDGTPWMESWRARHEGGKTLIDTGLLLSRLTHQADAGGVEWGFQDRRARVLHFGTVVIPARPMVGVDAADIAEIVAIVGEAIEARAGEGGAP